jgi:hypothetical protein
LPIAELFGKKLRGIWRTQVDARVVWSFGIPKGIHKVCLYVVINCQPMACSVLRGMTVVSKVDAMLFWYGVRCDMHGMQRPLSRMNRGS